MKVLLINNCHWRRGGSEAVYFGIADLLVEAGHEVVFLSFVDKKNIHTNLPEYFVKHSNPIKSVIEYFANSEAASVIEEVIKTEKPDIAHAHLLWGGMTASIIPVLHKYGIPFIHTVHDYRMVCPAYTFRNARGGVCEQCKGGKFWQCAKNRCSKGSLIQSIIMTLEMFYRNWKWHPANTIDGLVYVSNFAKQKHEEMDSTFSHTYNTVLYNFTTKGDEFPPVEKDAGYYLYYGRLSYEKGVSSLLDVFLKHPELKLKIVGTGPLEKELKKKLATNRITTGTEAGKNIENIQFLGYHSGSALAELVRNARFVCVPSEWYENNPMTIVEAYSMGVPVIGAKIGGIPEIVEEGETGFLFESGNVESLEDSLSLSLALNDDDYVLMRKNAMHYAEEHFNSRSYVKRLVGFYEEVIKRFNSSNE